MIKITEKQKNELKSILDEKEYSELLKEDIAGFFTELHLLMIGYMDENYNHTNLSYKLQELYDEIYSQNESEE